MHVVLSSGTLINRVVTVFSDKEDAEHFMAGNLSGEGNYYVSEWSFILMCGWIARRVVLLLTGHLIGQNLR